MTFLTMNRYFGISKKRIPNAPLSLFAEIVDHYDKNFLIF